MTEEYIMAPEDYTVLSNSDGKTGFLFQSIGDIAIGCVAITEIFECYEECTKTYYTIRLSWCSPCAIKLPRWNSLIRIFSAELWVSVIFALIIGALAMMAIARFGDEGSDHKQLILAFLNAWTSILGLSISSTPHTNALRLFFFAWICYGIATNTVFQAYFTSYLIDPGYEKPITTIEEMVNSKKPFGYHKLLDDWFNDSSDPIAMAILKNRIHCPDYDTFIHWGANYHNFSSLINNVKLEYFFWNQTLIDENNKPMICQLDDGIMYHKHVTMIMTKGNPLIPLISDIIDRVYESGIFL
ncbi:hypothetical protein C0J52_28382 [Blattella germanica]|nr:hypothetical protein C0J52_28382 [Blattella germanica]